jgi:hypothetical protein
MRRRDHDRALTKLIGEHRGQLPVDHRAQQPIEDKTPRRPLRLTRHTRGEPRVVLEHGHRPDRDAGKQPPPAVDIRAGHLAGDPARGPCSASQFAVQRRRYLGRNERSTRGDPMVEN